jgi:hypothetical protein
MNQGADMTPLSILAQRCGMTHMQVAEHFSVSLDTVRGWSSGRRGVPLDKLYELAVIASSLPKPTLIPPVYDRKTAIFAVPSDNLEAKKLGYPTVADYETALGPFIVKEVLEKTPVVLIKAVILRHSERPAPVDVDDDNSIFNPYSTPMNTQTLLKTDSGYILSLSAHDYRGVKLSPASLFVDELQASDHIAQSPLPNP